MAGISWSTVQARQQKSWRRCTCHPRHHPRVTLSSKSSQTHNYRSIASGKTIPSEIFACRWNWRVYCVQFNMCQQWLHPWLRSGQCFHASHHASSPAWPWRKGLSDLHPMAWHGMSLADSEDSGPPGPFAIHSSTINLMGGTSAQCHHGKEVSHKWSIRVMLLRTMTTTRCRIVGFSKLEMPWNQDEQGFIGISCMQISKSIWYMVDFHQTSTSFYHFWAHGRTAASIAALVVNVTKPKPRERPLSWEIEDLTDIFDGFWWSPILKWFLLHTNMW